MEEQSQSNAPIGLEMSRRGKIGCVLTVVAILVALWTTNFFVVRSAKARSIAASERLYALAKEGNFAAMERLTTKSAILTLKKAEELNGKISSARVVGTTSQILGRPTNVDIEVIRNGKPYIAMVALLDSKRVALVVEVPKEDFEKNRFDRMVREIAK